MPLPWVRLDSNFATNPKLLAMIQDRDGWRAALVYVFGLAYAGSHGTGGFIPREALPVLHARKADAERLAAFGFWKPDPGGWIVHDWDEYQLTGEEIQVRRERARSAAAARWSREPDRSTPLSGAERTRRWRERRGM